MLWILSHVSQQKERSFSDDKNARNIKKPLEDATSLQSTLEDNTSTTKQQTEESLRSIGNWSHEKKKKDKILKRIDHLHCVFGSQGLN